MASTPHIPLNGNGGRGGPARLRSFSGADFGLRALLFASSATAIVVLLTSKQTVGISVFLQPQSPIFIHKTAKFSHSPAFIYLLVALIIASMHSLVTLLTSASFLSKKPPSSKLLFRLMAIDLIMAGMMISATGSAFAVAYIGLNGNSHVMWNKICNFFGRYCWHIGSATGLSLLASTALLTLVLLSSYAIYRRSI